MNLYNLTESLERCNFAGKKTEKVETHIEFI